MPFWSKFRDLLSEDKARTDRALASAPREQRATSTLTEPAEWLLQVFGTQSKAGALVNENSALTVATFGACVQILGNALATPPLRLMRRTTRGAEPAKDHPLFFIVGHEPNGRDSSFRWRSFSATCLCLGGNSYTQIQRNNYFEIESLNPMLPVKTQARALAGNDFSGEIYYTYKGQNLAPHEVLHVRGLSTDGFFGISPIRALRESLGLALTMQEFTARTFNNGNRQPGVLKGPAQMNTEKAKEFLQVWHQTYGGAQNSRQDALPLRRRRVAKRRLYQRGRAAPPLPLLRALRDRWMVPHPRGPPGQHREDELLGHRDSAAHARLCESYAQALGAQLGAGARPFVAFHAGEARRLPLPF